MPYKVHERRTVSREAGRYGGMQAALIKTNSGLFSWGFGATDAEAEYHAVMEAREIERDFHFTNTPTPHRADADCLATVKVIPSNIPTFNDKKTPRGEPPFYIDNPACFV